MLKRELSYDSGYLKVTEGDLILGIYAGHEGFYDTYVTFAFLRLERRGQSLKTCR